MKIRAMQKGNMTHNINNFGNRPILKADYSSLIIKLSRKRPNKMPNMTRPNSLNHTIFICNKDSSHHAIAAAKWQASSLSSCIQWPLVVLATVPGVAIDRSGAPNSRCRGCIDGCPWATSKAPAWQGNACCMCV
jgi:hypothetical protein